MNGITWGRLSFMMANRENDEMIGIKYQIDTEIQAYKPHHLPLIVRLQTSIYVTRQIGSRI